MSRLGGVFGPPVCRVTVRVLRPPHCLCETLGKSPRCDNWLPRVLVSFAARHRRPLQDGAAQDGRGEADRRVCLNLFGEKEL